MKTIEVTLYEFKELSPEVQKKVISRESNINTDYDWWDATYDDFATFCETIGIEVDLKNTHFTLSYSQGDGAGFSASIDLPKLLTAIETQSWKDGYPKEDLKFYPVTTNMKRVCKLISAGKIDGKAWIEESNRGTSSTLYSDYVIMSDKDTQTRVDDALNELIEFLEDVTKKINYWFFRNLRNECDYLSSEEAIIETIEANEYTFEANGKMRNV